MSTEADDRTDSGELTYPRFDHGSNLWILARSDGLFEFRTETDGESIAADNTVYLKDVT